MTRAKKPGGSSNQYQNLDSTGSYVVGCEQLGMMRVFAIKNEVFRNQNWVLTTYSNLGTIMISRHTPNSSTICRCTFLKWMIQIPVNISKKL